MYTGVTVVEFLVEFKILVHEEILFFDYKVQGFLLPNSKASVISFYGNSRLTCVQGSLVLANEI